jgi:hypothetical protein
LALSSVSPFRRRRDSAILLRSRTLETHGPRGLEKMLGTSCDPGKDDLDENRK